MRQPFTYNGFVFSAKKLGLIAMTLLSVHFGQSQVLDPVTLSPIIQPPYSIYLSNYFISGQERFIMNAAFNDLNEVSLQVRLKVTIEGQGIRLTTAANYKGSPITIYPGSNVIDPQDIRPYFNFNNLDAAGISKQQLLRTGALPEGFYTFCIEMLDYPSGISVSNLGCTSATLIRNMPPIHVSPMDASSVAVQDPQNMLFQWQAISDVAVNTVYELTLVQVPSGISPNDAINGTNTPLLNAEPTNSSVFYYGPDQLPLEIGSQYAWRVKAKDINDIAVFENNGLSQVTTFTYGFSLNGNIPRQIPIDSSTIDPTAPYLQWQAPENAVAGTLIEYRLKVAELQSGQTWQSAINNSAAYTSISPAVNSTVGYSASPTGLLKGKSYVWQVTAEIGDVEVARSSIGYFETTPDVEKIYAGPHQVIVSSLTNGDKNNLAGTGTLKILTGQPDAEVSFSELKIKKIAGKWVLNGGQITKDLTGNSIILPIDYQEEDGVFNVSEAVLTKNGLELLGLASVPLYFGDDSTRLVSDTTRVAFDNYKISQSIPLAAEQTIQIGGPTGFIFNLTENSSLETSNNNGTLNINGLLTLPSSVTADDNNLVAFRFSDLDNIYAFDESTGYFENRISIWASALSVLPKVFDFDFNTASSPGENSGDGTWMGLDIEGFELVHQFTSAHPSRMTMDLTGVPYTKSGLAEASAFIDKDGFTFKMMDEYGGLNASASDYLNFTKPSGRLTKVSIDIEKNAQVNGQLLGSVTVPTQNRDFDFVIPINDSASSYFTISSITGGNANVVWLDKPYTAFDDMGYMEGKGKFLISNTDSTNCELGAVVVNEVESDLIITEGSALADLSDIQIDVKYPMSDVTYSLSKARVDANGLAVYSNPEPLATGLTASTGAVKVQFLATWLKYDAFKINQTIKMASSVTATLIDPQDFVFHIDTTSSFIITDNALRYEMNGNVQLPTSIKNLEGEMISFGFEKEDDILYITGTADESNDAIELVKNSTISITPAQYTLDFSESQSPGHLTGSGFWKGFYATQFNLEMPNTGDEVKTLTNNIDIKETIQSNSTQFFHVSGSGLQVALNYSIPQSLSSTNYFAYQGFEGKMKSIKLNIEDGQIKSGGLFAMVKVGLIDLTKLYDIEIPFQSSGLGLASFDDGISGKNKTFLEGEDSEVTVTVESAAFNSKGQIKLTATLEFPAYALELTGLNDLILTNNGGIGFGKENGTHTLASQVTGEVGGAFTYTASSVEAVSLSPFLYAFNVTGVMVLADNLAGSNGPIEANFGSLALGALLDNPLYTIAQDSGELTELTIGTPVAIKVGPVSFDVKFSYLKDDPDYGNSVQSYANVKLSVPVKFSVLAQLIVGEKDGYNYWFARVGAGLADNPPPSKKLKKLQDDAVAAAENDANSLPNTTSTDGGLGGSGVKGTGMADAASKTKDATTPATTPKKQFKGIRVGPALLTAIEGRIYHHMDHKEGGGISNVDYLPNEAIVFGFYLRVRVMDAAKEGHQYMVDGSIEANFNGESLNFIAIAADIALKNKMEVGRVVETMVTGGGEISYNVPEKRFIANIYVESEEKVCLQAYVKLDVSPTSFSIDIGDFDNMIMVTPGCKGWGGLGFVHIDDTLVSAGLGVSLTAQMGTGWKHIGVAMAKADVDVGVAAFLTAEIQYNPNFMFNKAGLYLRAWAVVSVSAQVPALSAIPLNELKANLSLELANIYLQGGAVVYFQDPKRIVGSFDASITLLETITFDINVEGEIPLT